MLSGCASGYPATPIPKWSPNSCSGSKAPSVKLGMRPAAGAARKGRRGHGKKARLCTGRARCRGASLRSGSAARGCCGALAWRMYRTRSSAQLNPPSTASHLSCPLGGSPRSARMLRIPTSLHRLSALTTLSFSMLVHVRCIMVSTPTSHCAQRGALSRSPGLADGRGRHPGWRARYERSEAPGSRRGSRPALLCCAGASPASASRCPL